MGKQYKKSIVYPEKAREWLSRYEAGEALKSIAHNDHYDIRTIKRQVEEATSERLMQQVRQDVLRSALEKHFSDFISLAERMRDTVMAGVFISFAPDDLPLVNGLKQHLSRSPLWDYMDKYQALMNRTTEFKNAGEEPKTKAGKFFPELDPKLNNVLFKEREINALEIKENAQDLYVGNRRKTTSMGRSERLINDAGMVRLQENLIEELTTIILRRVVAGHCRYCPV